MRYLAAFYFSGTGNTRYVTDKLCDSLKGLFKIKKYDIAKIVDYSDALTNADVIMLAYPIYGSNPPIPMRNFVHQYAMFWQNKEIIIVCTQYMFSGDGAASIGRTVEKMGGNVKYAEHFNMPNNLADIAVFKIRNGKDLKVSIERVNKAIDGFANKIMNGKECRRGFNIVSHAVGYYCQRKWWRKNEKFKQSALKIDINLCIGCGKCVKDCPVGNLVMDNGKAHGRNKCVLCYRCVNICPQKAITILGNSTNIEQYSGIEK